MKIENKYCFGDVVSYRNPDHRFSDVHIGRIVGIVYEYQEGGDPYIAYWVNPIDKKYREQILEAEIFGTITRR